MITLEEFNKLKFGDIIRVRLGGVLIPAVYLHLTYYESTYADVDVYNPENKWLCSNTVNRVHYTDIVIPKEIIWE